MVQVEGFDAALVAFCAKAQQMAGDRYVLSVECGTRYVRVVKTIAGTSQRSVYCFVDRTNGDVLKAASWKAPAKHARGNIFREAHITPYGAAYMR